MKKRAFPRNPYCECGSCDTFFHDRGGPVLLPASAWAVAGPGDLDRIAVAPGHEAPYVARGRPVEDFGTWFAVG